MLAIENEIDVLFTYRTGKPLGRIWSVKYGSISDIRRKQIDFAVSSAAVDWIKDIVIHKIDNQSALLISLQETDSKFESVINKINNVVKLHNLDT